mgnify:CR=1 FL=1
MRLRAAMTRHWKLSLLIMLVSTVVPFYLLNLAMRTVPAGVRRALESLGYLQ